MAGRKTSGTRREGDSWYGSRSGLGYMVYENIETNYPSIFDSKREGAEVLLPKEPASSLPDLRQLLIDYGKYRTKQEFAEDQYVRKFYALIPELNKSLNLLLEKVTGFGILTGLNYGNEDPCGFFRRLRGLDLPEHISKVLDRISDSAKSLCDLKAYTLEFLGERARLLMPNTTSLVGEEPAIELLYHAGSLRNLALMPASAIQVLGAERALFKHIIHGSPPPKHGALFKVKGMSSLRTKERGHVARYMAGKVAIALRADYAGTTLDLAKEKDQIERMLKRKK